MAASSNVPEGAGVVCQLPGLPDMAKFEGADLQEMQTCASVQQAHVSSMQALQGSLTRHERMTPQLQNHLCALQPPFSGNI